MIEPFSAAVATQSPDSSYKSLIDSRATLTGQLNRGRAALQSQNCGMGGHSLVPARL